MKNTCLFLFLIFGLWSQAQTIDQITLRDYSLVGDVVAVECLESHWHPTANEFQNSYKFGYNFDAKGYITQTEKYNTIRKMTYSKDYKQQTLDDGFGNKQTFFIIKTPARSFLTNTFDVVLNLNGSVRKVIEKTLEGDSYVHNFSYESNTISIDSNIDQPHKQRFTTAGVLLSEENEYLKIYYLYHPKSKLLTQKITKTKSATNNEYYINSYEYDTHGNWIVSYGYSSIPSVSNLIKPFNISVRTIAYKNKEKTGYNAITDDLKKKAVANISLLKINNLDAEKVYSLPLYVDYDLLSDAIATSNCIGNCQDGWGKYTYENGSYEGFWEAGKKQGYGNYNWTNGNRYTGNWVNDAMEGFGSTNFSNGSVHTGGYSDSKFQGNGYFNNRETGKLMVSYYENGLVVKSIPFGSTTQKEGCLNGDCTNGYGKFLFANGDRFMGDFENGSMKQGSYIFKNNDVYTGGFNANNRFDSYGLYNQTSVGNYYIGYWKDGKRNGKGYNFSNNKIEIAIWKNDVLFSKIN